MPTDAGEGGTFIYRNVSPQTAAKLQAWMRDNNIPRPVSARALHLSLFRSGKRIDWKTDERPIHIAADNISLARIQSNPNQLLVLNIKSPALEHRKQIIGKSAKVNNFDTSPPHITLSYDFAQWKPTKLTPLDFPIVLANELVTGANWVEREMAAANPDQWAYHYTNSENLPSIAKQGLLPSSARNSSLPHKQVYFMRHPTKQYQDYLKNNPGMYGDALLRTHVSNLPKDTKWKPHFSKGFHYAGVPTAVPPHKIEHHSNGKWVPLSGAKKEQARDVDWWKRYSKREQQGYLRDHPHSHLHINAAPASKPAQSESPKTDHVNFKADEFKNSILQGTGLQGKAKVTPLKMGGDELFIKTPASETTFLFKHDKQGNKVVDLVEFLVPPKKQGAGTAKTILRNSFDKFREMGVKNVELDAVSIGSYAWARYGFYPEDWYWKQNLQDKIRKRAADLCPKGDKQRRALMDRALKNMTDDPKSIWDIADINAEIDLEDGTKISVGKALLIDNGWAGHLPLQDKDAMKRFDTYTGGAKPHNAGKLQDAWVKKWD